MDEPQFDPQNLTTTLYDATLKGDFNSLQNLLDKDPLILDRCIIEKSDRFTQSPLYIALNLGHLNFVTELLSLKPELAELRDHSTVSTALHLAAAKGHLEIVKKLVELYPNMCLARDQDGLNPIHVAAISKQMHVLDWLVHTNPHAARERTNSGETVLHLCVKYGQIGSLKYLVDFVDDSELINAKDGYDNTVLHLAVVAKQLEVVKFLATNKKLQQKAINKNGLTALEWVTQNGKTQTDTEIIRILKRTKIFKANHDRRQKEIDDKWLKKQSNALMVVASLIATMAFQIGVNPPGGAWQEDSDPDKLDNHIPHLVGTSIMANRDPDTFSSLKTVNTISLISSLSVVLLLLSGIPCRRLLVILLIIIMTVATITTTLTYYYALEYLTKKSNAGFHPASADTKSTVYRVPLVIGWVILVFIGCVIRVLFRPLKNLGKLVRKKLRKEQDLAPSLVP